MGSSADQSQDANTPNKLGATYYYVDEAGDSNLFNRKKKVIVGLDGCSRFFILGKLEVPDPDYLAQNLNKLRADLLADPYFAGVPSMLPEQLKTTRMFHAKDDVPEVRREVFKLLLDFEIRFHAVVRDKIKIANKVREHNKKNSVYRYHPNQLYDKCIPALFENRLHQHQAYRIVFARRGTGDRTDALKNGLQAAKDKFRQKWGIESAAPIEVVAADSAEVACLQATDYLLWALQRCFERGEHRYIEMFADKIGLIIDRDDTRNKPTGEYYTRRNPIPHGFR